MAAPMTMELLFVLLLLWLFNGPDLASGVSDKCIACKAVAAELEEGLANERPRNHLDMRHRLDSRGQREGKVIDYKVSELRVLELLDDLCTKMKKYTLNKAEGIWVKLENKSEELAGAEKQEYEAQSKEISVYCGRLLEKVEDELSSKIRAGLKAGDVEDVLCREISLHCILSKDNKEQNLIEEL